MGVESLPLLGSIWASILAVSKIIWESIRTAASRAAFYFATVVPMLVRWFVKRRLFFLGLLLIVFGVVRSFLNLVSNLISTGVAAVPSFQFVANQFSWMFYLTVHGPLALDTAYSYLLNDIIPMWFSLVALKWMGAHFKVVSFITKCGYKTTPQ